MRRQLNFLDLFAGAGGLSEGFIRAGFEPIAHIESNIAACFTLRTRAAYRWLKMHNQERKYLDYLTRKMSRESFYNQVPTDIIDSVIHAEIGKNQKSIFNKVDNFLQRKKVDLIIGGPPCQAYSLIGRANSKNGMRDDARSYLYRDYADFLKYYKPSYFIFENVTGLLSAKNKDNASYLTEMQKLFKEYGYETEYKVLSAKNYGVLQNRKRIILVGKLGNETGFYPDPNQWEPDVKVAEIFSDLPKLFAGEGVVGPCEVKKYYGRWLYDAKIKDDDFPITWHQSRPNHERDLEIYKIATDLWNTKKARLDYNSLPPRLKTHKQTTSFLDRFKVVAGDLSYSHTVVAHIAKDGHYYIHPSVEQNRSITPREAARLQSFPDNYFFEGTTEKPSRTAAFTQIGNAVPVLMAYKLAEKIMETW